MFAIPRWGFVMVLLLVLAGLGVWFCARGEYAFLVVEESNSLGPEGGWSGQEAERAAWYDPEGEHLYLHRGTVRPWHRLVCLHEVDGAGVLVESNLLTAVRFPARISLLRAGGDLAGGTRLLAGDLEVLGGDGQGGLRLRYDGREFALRPGETWAELRVQGPDGVVIHSDQDVTAWKRAAEEAVAAAIPATRLSITYHGLWPRTRVARGETP